MLTVRGRIPGALGARSLVPAIAFAFLALPAQAAEPIVFEDVTVASGVARILEGEGRTRPWRYAHGAAWGDADGDGRPDLYVGAFAARAWYEGADAPLPNRLILNRPDGFRWRDDPAVEFGRRDARCASALFADLDGDGDLDLVVANHVMGASQRGSRIFENVGGERFKDVTPDESPWNAGLGIRNVAAIDADEDGRLDLLLADGSYGREAAARARLYVLQNRGGFRFADISESLGLPRRDTPGLGLAIGDVNDDGRPDIFVAGSNKLFVTAGARAFREAHPGRFAAPPVDRSEGLHCGAAFADLDGDELLDLVTTEHGEPSRVHVFRNRGIADGIPDLVEVSREAGLGDTWPEGTRAMPIKLAHVALRDFDLDGRIDMLLTAIARTPEGAVQPVVLRNRTARAGEIRFEPPPFDRLTGYYAPGPVADFDRDGRVDVFLPSWFESMPSRLFRNATRGGHGVTVRVTGRGSGLNPVGIGAVVRAYASGHLGDPAHLLARADIAIGTGYASGEEAVAHLGLGDASHCDLRVRWCGIEVDRRDVAADQWITIPVDRSE